MKCDWHAELDRFCEMSDKRERDYGSSPSEGDESEDGERSTKKPRTSEDFYSFCTHILDYENYEEMKKEEEEYLGNSTLGKEPAMKPSHNNSGESNSLVEITSDDSYDLITCFCQKPFAGRPMIECNACFTWIHLRCAKVKKSEIPDIFICPSCKKQPH